MCVAFASWYTGIVCTIVCWQQDTPKIDEKIGLLWIVIEHITHHTMSAIACTHMEQASNRLCQRALYTNPTPIGATHIHSVNNSVLVIEHKHRPKFGLVRTRIAPMSAHTTDFYFKNINVYQIIVCWYYLSSVILAHCWQHFVDSANIAIFF